MCWGVVGGLLDLLVPLLVLMLRLSRLLPELPLSLAAAIEDIGRATAGTAAGDGNAVTYRQHR